VHTAHQLALLLAAEKSKTPFYIAGGVLVAWALVISMAIGMRRPGFPNGPTQERAVIALSAVLVVIAVAVAVATSGGKAGGGEATAAGSSPQSTSSTQAATTPSSTATAAQPTATTGTPPPASSPAAGKGTALALAADPSGQLAFDAKRLGAKAGTVTIAMANMSPIEHNLTVAQGSKVLGATPTFVGGSRTLTLKLKPGTYTFYCSVPGHKQAGMEGTLTVSA
jgi:uncharacterized cupredoxin-like copper-binding protein